MKEYWNCLFLDNEKDMIVSLFREGRRLYYELETPNHHTGNLIRNFARLCGLPLSVNEKGLQVIRGEIPCYIDARNQEVYILRFADTKVANIYTDGRIEMKASVPAVAKTLMSQTKDYRLDASKTIFKTYILRDVKFRTDLHTHMNGNLSPDVLIALGIMHQIRYPLYYIRKLDLVLTDRQEKAVMAQREKVAKQFVNSELKGKYLTRRINDNTFVNFADLILNNLENAEQNIVKIRISLAVLKDGQAVFTNLEKVYLYRYVFTNRTLIETGAQQAVWEKRIEPDYNSYMGLVFEKVCRDYLCAKNANGELPILFTSIGRWWGTNPVTHSQEEIDLVANDGKDYIFGECKWRNDKTDLSVLCELKAKADIFSKNKNNTYYDLFSKSGFTDAVINEAKSDSSIILADLNEIMNF